MYSFTPENNPGGGGWTIMVFSLGSLYEDYDHLKNIWTKSNVALPLVRYTGCTLKFFQSDVTDYIVIYDTCWPMVDTPDTHADCSPSRMLQRKHKIIIPSKQTQNRKKPYKRVKIKPPHQMLNRWYFQKDICDTPLLMLQATAISLTNPFANTAALSNNINFLSLNTFLFANPQFQHFPLTTGYSHKILQGKSMYLYANHTEKPNQDGEQLKTWLKEMHFLGNTKENQPGKPYKDFINAGNNSKQNWGNPFYHEFLERTSETSYTIYTSNRTTLEVEQYLKAEGTTTIKNTDFQIITGPIAYKLTYNPSKDTGENKIYLIDTQKQITYDEPENQNLIYEGLPLYNLMWGWTDFIKKLKIINTIDYNTILVIKSKVFDDNTLNIVLPIDLDFLDGYDPYQPHEHNTYQQNYYNKQNWFPKLQFQEQTINHICTSGPGSPNTKQYLQSLCKYSFYFKWGGCPKQLPKALNPCLQSKWPTPDNINGRLTIQNPNTSPETELYCWDWEKDFVTDQAIKRIQQYTLTDETLFSPTETKSTAKVLQKEKTAKEEEKNLLLKLNHLRKQRLHLELKCKLQLQKLKSKTVT